MLFFLRDGSGPFFDVWIRIIFFPYLDPDPFFSKVESGYVIFSKELIRILFLRDGSGSSFLSVSLECHIWIPGKVCPARRQFVRCVSRNIRAAGQTFSSYLIFLIFIVLFVDIFLLADRYIFIAFKCGEFL